MLNGLSRGLSGLLGAGKAPAPANSFRMRVHAGPTPPLVAGWAQQARQGTLFAGLLSSAALSFKRDSVGFDQAVRELLLRLQPTPLVAGPRALVEYSSRVGGAPDDVFKFLCEHLEELLGDAGLKIRPSTAQLGDGARVLLEDAGMLPGLWFPVELRVDPAGRTLTLQTLDGHPFCGVNGFAVLPAEKEGAVLRQRSEFQSSSVAAHLGAKLPGATSHQHEVWTKFHGALARRYRPPSSPSQLR